MPIQLNEENDGKLLAVHVSGKLTAADYEHFVPEFERLVKLHGKLRVLFDMTGSYRAAFINGIAWNVLNGVIAWWLLFRQNRRDAYA